MVEPSDQDLEQLLSDLEADWTERKESFKGDASNSIREAICAFANDLPNHRRAGVAFVGARDDGTPSGLPITDDLLRSLADIKTDGNILPPPTLTVSKRRLFGTEVAVILVQPSGSPPVRYRGRIHIRVGPRRALASAQDERILNEKRRHRDLPFDVHDVPSSSLSDLQRRAFEDDYLPSAVAPAVLAANERTYEQRLAACKMIASIDEPVPTVLGLLILGGRPRDFFPGAYLASPISDEQVIDGTVTDVIRAIDQKIASHNRVEVDFHNGPTEQRRSPYPLVAVQQIVRNAVMHRTYEATHAPIQIYWYADRIEVLSPGGPFGTVTEATFGMPGVVDYRNPNLAEALRVLGFVQRFGVGLATARRELERNGNPPLELTVGANRVQVVMKAAT